MDIPFPMGLGMLRVQDEHLVKLLGTLAAVFEHGAHGGIAVDVGVFPLDVAVAGIGIGDVLIDLHQPGIGLADPGAFRPVKDIRLGGAHMPIVDQHLLYAILDLFHLRLV